MDPGAASPRDVYKLLVGAIVPRPIAFVSTVNSAGDTNLAPFSFFTGICANPPVIGFSPGRHPDGRVKDTLRNIEETGEFVINIVSEEIAAQMNECSADFSPEVDEFAISGLTRLASEVVRPPRVAESPIHMECKLMQVIHVSTRPLGGSFVIGEVVRFHIDDALIENFRIDPDTLNAIGRMGGPTYIRTKDRFDMLRPTAG